MSSHPPLKDCLAVKKWCINKYSRFSWFKGCGLNTDEEECVVELRTDPENKDRFTHRSAMDGVRIRTVPFDPTKHSETED